MPQSIAIVQYSGTGEEEGWDAVLLHTFLLAQCTYQKGLLPIAMDTGFIGKHGRHGTFLNHEFQEWVLVGEDGARVPTLYHIYHGQPGVL